MVLGVGLVLELAGQEPAVALGCSGGPLYHAGAFFLLWREDDLCTHRAHQLAPLDRECFDHEGDERVTLRGTHHRQRDTGIAGGGLDDRLAGFEHAAAFGILDDADRETILDRGHRVEELDLDEQVTCSGASLLMRTTGVLPMVSRMLS